MTRKRNALPLRLAELSVAAPQVVAHRLSRMATAGSSPSAQDRREMDLMSTEKVDAFWDSWGAMFWESLAAQQRAFTEMQNWLWQSAFTSFTTPSPQTWMKRGASQWYKASLDVMAHGLAPVHRRAVANSKRLGAQPRR